MFDTSNKAKKYAPTPLSSREQALYAAPPALTALAAAALLQQRRTPGSAWHSLSDTQQNAFIAVLVAISLSAFFGVFVVYRIVLKQVASTFGAFGFDPVRSRRDAYLANGPVTNGGAIVVVSGERWMRFIHKEQMRLFNHEPGWPITFKEILGYDALFLMEDGPKHDRVRRIIVKAFHGDYFRDYAKRMVQIDEAWMEQMVEKGERSGEGGFPFHEDVTTLVFRVVSALLIGGYDGTGEGDGAEGGERQRENDRLAAEYQILNGGLLDLVALAMLSTFGKGFPLLKYTKFHSAMGARDRLLSHIEGVILTKRAAIVGGAASPALKDTLTLLCEDSDPDTTLRAMSEESLPVEQTNTSAVDGRHWAISSRLLAEMSLQLMLGAHDTTSSFLVCFVVEMLRHPAILQELRAEQDATWGTYTPNESHCEITAEFVQKKLPFMNKCITETERRYPPAPGNFRGAKESFEHDGIKVKQGTQIFYDALATNHDPYVYGEDSLEWKPHRWDGKSLVGSASRPYARVTFGAGPRNCLGQNFAKLNMKVFLTLMLRKYEIGLVGADSERFPIKYAPSLKFQDGVRVTFKRRVAAEE